MDPDRYNDDSTVDLLDSIEACLARIKDRIDVHGSAESAERALAEVRRRLSDEGAEIARLRGLLDGVGVSLLCAVAYQDGLSPSAHVMHRVDALWDARMGEIEAEMRRCATLVGWDELASGAAEGGEE